VGRVNAKTGKETRGIAGLREMLAMIPQDARLARAGKQGRVPGSSGIPTIMNIPGGE